MDIECEKELSTSQIVSQLVNRSQPRHVDCANYCYYY